MIYEITIYKDADDHSCTLELMQNISASSPRSAIAKFMRIIYKQLIGLKLGKWRQEGQITIVWKKI